MKGGGSTYKLRCICVHQRQKAKHHFRKYGLALASCCDEEKLCWMNNRMRKYFMKNCNNLQTNMFGSSTCLPTDSHTASNHIAKLTKNTEFETIGNEMSLTLSLDINYVHLFAFGNARIYSMQFDE